MPFMKLSNDIELLYGDCLDLLPKIPEGSINSIITDPHYFLGMTHNGQKGVFNDLVICKPFYEKLFSEYERVLKPDGCVYFFCDWRSYAFFYNYQHELMLFTTKRNAFNVKGTHSIITGILSFSNGAKKTNGEKLHPTQKPIELIEKFITDSTEAGDVILDTFTGSGTTGVACIRTGRKFIGMEIDDGYFEIAGKRIKAALQEQKQDLFYEEKGAVNE